MKKYIIMIVVVIGIVLLLSSSYYIYSNNNSQDNIDALISKADEEISYLSYTIISMMNRFNNITYANYKIVEEDVQTESQNQTSSSGGRTGRKPG